MRLTVLEEMQKQIRQPEAIVIETMQTKYRRKRLGKKGQNIYDLCDNKMWSNMHVIKAQEGGETEKKNE